MPRGPGVAALDEAGLVALEGPDMLLAGRKRHPAAQRVGRARPSPGDPVARKPRGLAQSQGDRWRHESGSMRFEARELESRPIQHGPDPRGGVAPPAEGSGVHHRTRAQPAAELRDRLVQHAPGQPPRVADGGQAPEVGHHEDQR